MCIYIYVYIYICIYIYIYTYMYIHTYLQYRKRKGNARCHLRCKLRPGRCGCARLRVDTPIAFNKLASDNRCLSMYSCVCVCECVRVSVCVCVRVCVRRYIDVYGCRGRLRTYNFFGGNSRLGKGA